MKSAQIEVIKRKKWYVRIKAENGKVWNCAESYATKSNAVRAANAFSEIKEFNVIVLDS